MKKKGDKKWPTPRQKVIHNPHPYLFLFNFLKHIIYFLCLMYDKEITEQNKEVGMGVMNYFLSWCRHLLVPFLFHALTSLHPPSFHRNDINCSTCSTNFFGQSPIKNVMFCAGSFLPAPPPSPPPTHARRTPHPHMRHVHAVASFAVCSHRHAVVKRSLDVRAHLH